MIAKNIKNSELIISDDGTLYHLGLKSDDNIPKNIFLVGDPDRVLMIAKYFDQGTTFKKENREFITVCGTYKKMPIAAISTGIGPDNAEIVAVELHALNEYDHRQKTWKEKYEPLNIIRIGTSGSPQKDIAVGSLAISEYAVGLDNTGIYYPYQSTDETVRKLLKALNKTEISKVHPYVSKANSEVVNALKKACRGKEFYTGITSSAPGFFAPQGRQIGRLANILIPNLQKILSEININGKKVINNEMESSVMFRIFGEILDYRVGTICAVLANRNKGEFVEPKEYTSSVDRAIRAGLEAMKILVAIK